MDGSKTVTYHAQLEGISGEEGNITGAAGRRKAPSSEAWMESAEGPELLTEGEGLQTEAGTEAAGPQLEMEVYGTGEDAQVTMEYGGAGLVFTPEIFEAAPERPAPEGDGEAAPETAGTAEVTEEARLAANEEEGNAEPQAEEEPEQKAPQPPEEALQIHQENTQPAETAPAETMQETDTPEAEETQGAGADS